MEMNQRERDYTAKQYNHIRKIVRMKQHEEESWDSIELLGFILFVSFLTYLIYEVIK